MVSLNDKKNLAKSSFVNCLIGKSQQLNHIYGASLIDFSLTLNGGFNVLIYNVSLTLFILLIIIENCKTALSLHGCVDFDKLVFVDMNFGPVSDDHSFVH